MIAGEVAATYVDLRVAQQRLGVAQRQEEEANQILRLVGLERSAGIVGDEEVHHARADLAGAAAAVAPLEAAAEAALQELAALTDTMAEALRSQLTQGVAVPMAPRAVPVGIASDLLKRRPDVRRVERELAAATADLGSAVAAQFPRLTLVGAGGLDSVRAGDLGAAASRYWNLAPQLSIPLFAGGRLRAQVKAAEAARDAAVANYRASVLRALAETESAIARYAAARTRMSAAEDASKALGGSVQAVERRQASGEASMIEVLAARRSADQAHDQQLSAIGDFSRAYVALNRSLGGGWRAGGVRDPP